jgi:hypothetical protein
LNAARFSRGLAAVAATIGILAMSVTALYLAAFLASQNRAAEQAGQEAKVGQAPKVPEFLSSYVYNFSLCNLLAGRLTSLPWTLLVVNTGNIPVEVDSVVVSIGSNIVFQRTGEWQLYPGHYLVADLSSISGNPALKNAVVQVHTSRGGVFIGGYGVPSPESVVVIDSDGRCIEP